MVGVSNASEGAGENLGRMKRAPLRGFLPRWGASLDQQCRSLSHRDH